MMPMSRARVALIALYALSVAGCSDCKKSSSGEGAGGGAAPPSTQASTSPSASSSDETTAPSDPTDPNLSEHEAKIAKATHPWAEFKPTTNGFKFRNYSNASGYANMRAEELRRMFGDGVCASIDGDKCTLTPPGSEYLEAMNRAMGGGHCEGMATLSLLLERGQLRAKDFGGSLASDLEIDGNEPLQREIAYWWATQLAAPLMAAARAPLTPNEVVDKLAQGLKTGTDSYTMGFFNRAHTGGHATTPYAIVDKGDGIVWIMHYDNNYPAEEKHIEVDRNANTWKYTTAADPDAPENAYEGDAETKSLFIAPTSVRVGRLQCPFCDDVASVDGAGGSVGSVEEGEAKRTARDMREIFADGAMILITDDKGKRLGFDGGKFVDEIDGALAITPMSGEDDDPFDQPIYDVPPGSKLTVLIDGSTIAKASSADVVMIGPGYTLGVQSVELPTGGKDSVEFSADWSEIRYVTKQTDTPEISIGVETKGADYAFEVNVSGESGGQTVDLAIDLKKGLFALQVHAADGKADFSVTLHKIDKGGEQAFTHKGLAVGSSEIVAFDYAAWKGDKTALHVTTSKADGTVEKEEDVGDEQ